MQHTHPMATPDTRPDANITRTAILNQQRSTRRTLFTHDEDVPEGPALSQHIVDRLEEYFQKEPSPSVAVTEFFASNLGVETRDIHVGDGTLGFNFTLRSNSSTALVPSPTPIRITDVQLPASQD